MSCLYCGDHSELYEYCTNKRHVGCHCMISKEDDYNWFYSCANQASDEWCESVINISKDLGLICECRKYNTLEYFFRNCDICDSILNGTPLKGLSINILFDYLWKKESELQNEKFKILQKNEKTVQEFHEKILEEKEITKGFHDKLNDLSARLNQMRDKLQLPVPVPVKEFKKVVEKKIKKKQTTKSEDEKNVKKRIYKRKIIEKN